MIKTAPLTRRPVSALLLAVALALAGCAGKFGDPLITEDIGPAIEDEAPLSLRVKAALDRNPQTRHAGLKVMQLSEDSVRLTGLVSNDADRYEAERVAGNVDGVRIVVNTIYVND